MRRKVCFYCAKDVIPPVNEPGITITILSYGVCEACKPKYYPGVKETVDLVVTSTRVYKPLSGD
jgi:hypothetical protein